MIKLFDKYEIHGNTHDYSLVEKVDGTSKKGEPITSNKVLGYYNSVEGCLQGLYKHIGRKIVAENELTLTEAIDAFAALQKRIESIIPGVLKV